MDILTPSDPTSVYLYLDNNGLLLYVGITSRGIRRQVEHNADKEWWPFVARQDVEHCSTRKQASARERELIRQYHPPFNKVHNHGWEEMRELYLSAPWNIAAFKPPVLGGKDALTVLQSLKQRLPLTQIDGGQSATFITPAAYRGIAQAVRPIGRDEQVILRAPRKVAFLAEMDPYADLPTFTFVSKRGGIRALRNVELHLKFDSRKPLVLRAQEAVGE